MPLTFESGNSLKAYRDIKNSIDTARDEGLQEGIEKGIAEERIRIIKSMLQQGFNSETISKATGLSIEEIEGLK